MNPGPSLHLADWIVIGAYLLFALAVGAYVRRSASTDKESYFLAARSLPWWWAGASIAATTFAADTPLAVTGIVASKGLSGNWLWLSWVGVHAAVVVLFAAGWSRSGVLTDAELIELRYSGRPASLLRWFRAGLYGIVFNCIILGWVLRAMVKIAAPFFHWERWAPRLVGLLETIWPAETALGNPSDGLTILLLLAIVGVYSSMGGIRGVIFTDLVQLALALIGAFWLAGSAWSAVGGRDGFIDQLTALYGPGHEFLDLFPAPGSGWLGAVGIGAFAYGLYLIVQSYANMPADGGGFLMQRLNTTRSPEHARRAAGLFLVLHYVVRIWPWFVVALAALVLIPLGAEEQALGGAGSAVAGDRELSYPILMGHLLSPGILGIAVVSLLAAFMSTVDTHINWGASYIVNDVFLQVVPEASNRSQILIARLAVAGFVVLAVLVSFQIETIEQAWQWVATLGAALGLPTALRWLWWRVTATSEIIAMAAGLAAAIVLVTLTEMPYELRLIWISSVSAAGMFVGLAAGPPTSPATLARFQRRVRPLGRWPDGADRNGLALGFVLLARWLAIVVGVVLLLVAVRDLLFFPARTAAWGVLILACVSLGWGMTRVRWLERVADVPGRSAGLNSESMG